MKIFVVIVTFNAEKWIIKCIESVLNNTLDADIVIVDNHSIDNTINIINSQYPECVVIQKNDNQGFGIANNIGIQYALEKEADYIVLLNQDAWLHNEALDKLIYFSRLYPNYGILSPMFFSYNGHDLDEYLLKWVYYYNIEMASDIYFRREKDVYDVPLMPAAMWVMKAEAIKDSGLFDPLFFMYKEDDDLWRRMKNHGWKAGIFPKAIAYHHTSKGNNFTIKKRIWHNYGLMILNLKNTNTNFSKNLLAFFIDYFKRTFISIIFFNKSELYVLQYSFISVLIKLHIIYRHRVVCASKGAFLSDKYL